MPSDRQIQLEELLAHQQHVLDALNAEVVAQRNELSLLGLSVAKLESKVKTLSDSVDRSGDDLPHEKPPHY